MPAAHNKRIQRCHPLAAAAGGLHHAGMPDSIDPKVKAKAEQYLSAKPNSRAAKAIREMLSRGVVTTDDLAALGYNHPPRAIQDVKDATLPVIQKIVLRQDGKRMASYRFPTASEAVAGRAFGGGRLNITPAFRRELMQHYGEADTITGAKLPRIMLTVDHRVPFQVGGDAGLESGDVTQFMLLDRSMQRVKAWACQHCPNVTEGLLNPEICKRCFWAFPESYDHVATQSIRRTDVVWQGDDVPLHDRLRERAQKQGVTVADLLRDLARQS